MIRIEDKLMSSDDVCMEEVNAISGKIMDIVLIKLKNKGLAFPKLVDELENDIYDDVCDHVEKTFNYPDYRHHN